MEKEKPFSTSKVTVEYFDPHDVFKLVEPNLLPRLPLRHLNWQSHSGPIRSIETLHIDLVPFGSSTATESASRPATASATLSTASATAPSIAASDDGFQTQNVSGGSIVPAVAPSATTAATVAATPSATATTDEDTNKLPHIGPARRHQIPGLRRTPYLKLLFVRCDDNDAYKERVRSEIKEWIKTHTPKDGDSSKRKLSKQEGHDAFEWLIVHVVLPNTVAATQPRTTAKTGDSVAVENKTTLKWRGGTTLLEKLRADFGATSSSSSAISSSSGSGSGGSGSKTSPDRLAQIRIGINDVPYDLLPRVVPAVPSGYVETREDVDAAWGDFISKLKNQILQSFDTRVHFYEDDIKDKDSQRAFAGWNFCTFFILKEGLARGFESVGLVEDALVGYDELSVGLDVIVQEQADSGTPSLLPWTPELRDRAEAALNAPAADEAGDFQGSGAETKTEKKRHYEDIPISASKKPYRDLILANNVSLFDFRCYIFARQVALLSRLGNAWATREELLAKLHSQQEAIQPGVAPLIITTPNKADDTENLGQLAEVCRRTLQFIPAISAIMRADLIASFAPSDAEEARHWKPEPRLLDITENLVSAFAFAVAQQMLAQTSTDALPIPPPSTPSTPTTEGGPMSFPDAKAAAATASRKQSLMLPAATRSVLSPGGGKSPLSPGGKPPLSPGIFPGPAAQEAIQALQAQAAKQQNKNGLEDLAARRAELYTLCRNVLEQLGKKKGWENGWATAPMVGEVEGGGGGGEGDFEDVDLCVDESPASADQASADQPQTPSPPFAATLTSLSVNSSRLLAVALDSEAGFYRLYEMLTDKSLRHYTMAGYDSAVQALMADMAMLKMLRRDFAAAAPYLQLSTDFYGDRGWSLVELSLLVQYSRCLRSLGRKDDFVRVTLKLLTKTAICRFDSLRPGAATPAVASTRPELAAVSGLVTELLTISKSLTGPKRIALVDFFCGAEIAGPPEYVQGKDMFVLQLALKSLLLEDLPVDSGTLRLTSTEPGVQRTIVLQAGRDRSKEKEGSREKSKEKEKEKEKETTAQILNPGTSIMRFTGTAPIPGHYKADHLVLNAAKVQLIWDFASLPSNEPDGLFKSPNITLFQRPNSFNVDAAAATHTRLHSNNSLDITVSTGWNSVSSCEIAVRPASGGLRLLSPDAVVVTAGFSFAKKPEAGHFRFSSLPPETTVTFRFPFSLEADGVSTIALRLEASYSTSDGIFSFARARSIPVGLAVGVNVQDVFKHHALFSRFTISSATTSPMYLFSTELSSSEGYTAEKGSVSLPDQPVVIHTKQPASVLYRIKRTAAPLGPAASTTMTLHLAYALVRDQVTVVVQDAVRAAVAEAPAPLPEYALVLSDIALAHAQASLTPYDLEKNTLLDHLPTDFLATVDWPAQVSRVAGIPASSGVAMEIAAYMRKWQTATPRLSMQLSTLSLTSASLVRRSIQIPVDVPPLDILITADMTVDTAGAAQDIRLAKDEAASGVPTVCVNQMLPARLCLKWTRAWAGPGPKDTVYYAYDVTAPSDTWLVGGRKRGVITVSSDATSGVCADVPLMLVPLRQGWIGYPAVDVRETGPPGGTAVGGATMEVDYRNVGDVVRVVSDRGKVTLSLDASGPGGGPLVLESERILHGVDVV
ncbi:hypothetical protein TD95_003575 [Thielaviopsis punctulata]|uniref:Trafficking protein particle complex subunit 10 n=1 Tax=Thielaviopsis punctulata TaxID=72032 RepID=A0A0F4ZHG8_9PEZI|nr:hypothetical protein TD95_003575 [Thielaviopsis punctulata]